MYYAIYRNVRDSAWKCLLNFRVNSLPVNVVAIAHTANIHVIRNSLVNKLVGEEKGKALTDGRDWIIIYSSKR